MAGWIGWVTFGKRISPVIFRNRRLRQSYVVSFRNCPGVTYIKRVHTLTTTGDSVHVESWTGSVASRLDGKSEISLRKFVKVFQEADKNDVAIICDELELTAPKREKAQGQVGRRIMSQLLLLMNGVKQRPEVFMPATKSVNNINGIEPVKREFQRLIQYPVEHPEEFLK